MSLNLFMITAMQYPYLSINTCLGSPVSGNKKGVKIESMNLTNVNFPTPRNPEMIATGAFFFFSRKTLEPAQAIRAINPFLNILVGHPHHRP